MMSNAFERSHRVTSDIFLLSIFLCSVFVTFLDAISVDNFGRYPCWLHERRDSKKDVSCWDTIFSFIFDSSGKSEIGRQLLVQLWPLLLSVGMAVACFYTDGNKPVTIEVLMMVDRYVMMTGRPACMQRSFISSQPVELVLFRCLMVRMTVFISTGSGINAFSRAKVCCSSTLFMRIGISE